MKKKVNLEKATSEILTQLFRKQKIIDTAAEFQRVISEKSLADYVREAWPILNPSTPFVPNWHLDLVCEYLHACSLGQITRLVINVPPKSTKSTIVSVVGTKEPPRLALDVCFLFRAGIDARLAQPSHPDQFTLVSVALGLAGEVELRAKSKNAFSEYRPGPYARDHDERPRDRTWRQLFADRRSPRHRERSLG